MVSEEDAGRFCCRNGGGLQMTDLERRVIDISYKHKLSHLGSVLTSLPIIQQIYKVKKMNEPFVNSCAHNSLALYVILEKYEFKDAEKLLEKHGVHCNRDMEDGIWASGGSLGHGIGIAVGMALADRSRNVYALLSDGECAEGSVWEALRIASEQRLENLRVTVNANSWGAYGKIDPDLLDLRLQYFYPSLLVKTNLLDWPEWLQGQEAHYHTMTEEEYKEVTK